MNTQCLTLKQLLYQAHEKRNLIDADMVRILKSLGETSETIKIMSTMLLAYNIEVTASVFSPEKFIVTWPIGAKTVKYKSIW